jgi:transcriptional regulator GlxA family with amidase domain
VIERREFLGSIGAMGFLGVAGFREEAPKLTPPEKGKIPVAFLTSESANVIDTAGPWEVFQDVHVPGRGSSHDDMMPFQLFTVADKGGAVRMTGGLRVTPDYTVDDAPQPRVIVVPAMQGTPRTLDWLRAAGAKADLTMSVCTGAFQLARAGLLDGLEATTHHDFWDRFASEFPKVQLKRGPRFVEGGPKIATAGGLTSGIDMALRVVERYFGRPVAEATARYMEHESKAWQVS